MTLLSYFSTLHVTIALTYESERKNLHSIGTKKTRVEVVKEKEREREENVKGEKREKVKDNS